MPLHVVTENAMSRWDKMRDFWKNYKVRPEVKRKRAQKLLENLKKEKEKQYRSQLKGYDYGGNIVGPGSENKENKTKKRVQNDTDDKKVCKFCKKVGHVRRSSKFCDFNKKNLENARNKEKEGKLKSTYML